MLSNLIFCVNAVLPIFLLVFFGYFLKRTGLLDSHTAGKLNTLCFKWALPALLFKDLLGCDFGAVANPRMMLFATCAILVEFLMIWLISSFFIKDKKKLGSFVQIGYRSNYVILGITLITNIYGESQAAAVASVITAIAIPCYNVLAVVLLTRCGGKGGRIKVGELLLGIVKNPLIIAAALGIAGSFLPFELPGAITKAVSYVAQTASPIAFLVIGARIEFRGIFNRWSLAAAAVRLVAVPLVGVMAAVLMGFRGAELMSLLVLFAAPTAVSSYAMASSMGCDEELAANGVFVTTLLSVVTITAALYIVRALGLA